MTTTGALTRELIADATLWRLILRIGSDRLSALLIGPESVERSVLFHSEALADGSVRTLENAVYDNPLLLADFASVDVIFATSELFAAPAEMSTLREAMADAMLPDFIEPRRIEAEAAGGSGAEIVYGVAADLFNFVARTFASARFHHSLAVDASYLFHRNGGTAASAHLFALCEGPGDLALVGFNAAGRLFTVSRKAALTAADCTYFILAAAGSDAKAAGPISVGGEPSLRNEVCDLLRRMQPGATVLPLTLPEDLLHLRHMAPEATFDMIFLTQL